MSKTVTLDDDDWYFIVDVIKKTRDVAIFTSSLNDIKESEVYINRLSDIIDNLITLEVVK